MQVKVSLPDGKIVTITESTVCIKGSEERCSLIDKEKAQVLIEYAIHQGWKVEKVESS